MIFYEGSPELNIDSSWRQRASGFTLVFMKPPKTFMFHPSEQKGLPAWVLDNLCLCGWPKDILDYVVLKSNVWCCSSQAKAFFSPWASHHGRSYVDCLWLAHDGCSRSLSAVCGVQQVTLGVSPLSSHPDITIQHPWTPTHRSNSSTSFTFNPVPSLGTPSVKFEHYI